MFLQVSVCPQGRGVYPPGRHPLDRPPSPTWLSVILFEKGVMYRALAPSFSTRHGDKQRMVCILLECILVLQIYSFSVWQCSLSDALPGTVLYLAVRSEMFVIFQGDERTKYILQIVFCVYHTFKLDRKQFSLNYESIARFLSTEEDSSIYLI